MPRLQRLNDLFVLYKNTVQQDVELATARLHRHIPIVNSVSMADINWLRERVEKSDDPIALGSFMMRARCGPSWQTDVYNAACSYKKVTYIRCYLDAAPEKMNYINSTLDSISELNNLIDEFSSVAIVAISEDDNFLNKIHADCSENLNQILMEIDLLEEKTTPPEGLSRDDLSDFFSKNITREENIKEDLKKKISMGVKVLQESLLIIKNEINAKSKILEIDAICLDYETRLRGSGETPDTIEKINSVVALRNTLRDQNDGDNDGDQNRATNRLTAFENAFNGNNGNGIKKELEKRRDSWVTGFVRGVYRILGYAGHDLDEAVKFRVERLGEYRLFKIPGHQVTQSIGEVLSRRP